MVSKNYLIIASYNWGPHRIKSAIKKGKLSTRIPSSEVLENLQAISPQETKEYLRKVTIYMAEFKGLN